MRDGGGGGRSGAFSHAVEKDGVRFSTIKGRGKARLAFRAKKFEGAGMSRSYAAGSRSKNGAMHAPFPRSDCPRRTLLYVRCTARGISKPANVKPRHSLHTK